MHILIQTKMNYAVFYNDDVYIVYNIYVNGIPKNLKQFKHT